MGRTNPTYRDYLQRFEERCQPMRRVLRQAHKSDFDRLSAVNDSQHRQRLWGSNPGMSFVGRTWFTILGIARLPVGEH
jgi:hypothetical protein